MNNVQPSIPNEVVTHLQMIQSTIDRMCTSSALYKGFAATIIAGVAVASFNDINKWIIVLCSAMVLCFLFMDIYYLQLERRFRFLYEQVRTGEISSNYELTPPKVKDIRRTLKKTDKKNNVGLLSCIASKSILLFYVPLLIVCIVIIIMRFNCNVSAEQANDTIKFLQ